MLDLTTLLRKYPAIQGYIYTELSDIEWEHNGFYNYDRSPKDFGYGAFVPGMTPAALEAIGAIGVRLIDSRPRHGSMGASIAFLHPKDVGGVLTELVQAAETR